MASMGEKEPVYSIYGDSSRFSQATEEREMERVKSEALEALKEMGVRFPVRTKGELLKKIDHDRPTSCRPGGKAMSLKELAGSLRDSDFPLRSAAEAAQMLAAACPIHSESPEGAPDTRPF
jgi:hypothetical protein